ncbi:MAG TPA: amidase [Gaiellaceae bacterium]|nr:amidase [Gaiellaceae bacterium]
MSAADGIWLARPDRVGDGTPVAVKDLRDTAGLGTTYGSALFAEHVPRKSAAAVSRLEEAGYAVAGKTNLHEFAYGISSQNPHFGTVPNPRFPGHVAGGSSGGSAAAIAAGELELALGTDSGGSIRIPAAWCGVFGFKPTFDLVSTQGCFPLAPSYDHVGPLASSVAGCVEVLRALAPGFEAASLESLEEVVVGVTWLEDADRGIAERVAAAAELFPRRRALAFPIVDRAENALFMREVAHVHSGLFPDRAEEYGESVRWKLERCFEVTDGEEGEARRLRAEYRERCMAAIEGLDLLVTPTVPMVAPAADADERGFRGRGTRFTYPFNALGWPALAIPCGPAEDGLTASLQLVGRPGDDARVLAAGALLASLL